MKHSIFATRSPETAGRLWRGELMTEADRWECTLDATMTFPQARRWAHQLVAGGDWKAARVFEGRNAGRCRLQVVAPEVCR